MNLYFVRHGQTDWNASDRLQGQSDIPLNQTGIAQAESLRDQIRGRGLRFDAIYASPLQRVRKTAEIIADGQPIVIDRLLSERNAGQFEGGPPTALFDNEIDFLDSELNSGAFGVEPIRAFHARAANFLQNLRHLHPEDATILIVSSNGLMKRFAMILQDLPAGNIPNFQNAEIYNFNIR
jgi:broad specificity phosphatase PhoE